MIHVIPHHLTVNNNIAIIKKQDFREKIHLYMQQIQELDYYFKTLATENMNSRNRIFNKRSIGASGLGNQVESVPHILRNQHDIFFALTERVAILHETVNKLKDEFLNLRARYTGRNDDIFELRRKEVYIHVCVYFDNFRLKGLGFRFSYWVIAVKCLKQDKILDK